MLVEDAGHTGGQDRDAEETRRRPRVFLRGLQPGGLGERRPPTSNSFRTTIPFRRRSAHCADCISRRPPSLRPSSFGSAGGAFSTSRSTSAGRRRRSEIRGRRTVGGELAPAARSDRLRAWLRDARAGHRGPVQDDSGLFARQRSRDRLGRPGYRRRMALAGGRADCCPTRTAAGRGCARRRNCSNDARRRHGSERTGGDRARRTGGAGVRDPDAEPSGLFARRPRLRSRRRRGREAGRGHQRRRLHRRGQGRVRGGSRHAGERRGRRLRRGGRRRDGRAASASLDRLRLRRRRSTARTAKTTRPVRPALTAARNWPARSRWPNSAPTA